jgi:hypothetical protein
MAHRREKYCTYRNAGIHNHTWPAARAKQEWNFLSQQSAALEIRPCIQQDIVDTFLDKSLLHAVNLSLHRFQETQDKQT